MRAAAAFVGAAAVVLAAGLSGCSLLPYPEGEPREYPLDHQSLRANPEHPGFEVYRQYCAACHGVFADGNGPIAPLLDPRPADLTRLGEKYGMPLPRNELVRYITGERPVRAHGTSDMPVWGEKLFEDVPEGPGKTAGKRGRVLLIIDYLESIQARDGG